MSRFVVIVWIFAVLILTSNYTATLTSVMTVQQIRGSKSNENIGFFSASIAANVVKDNPAFHGPRYKGLQTADDFINALKNGTISYIVDEVPYVKLFVAKYPSEFEIVKTESVTNGFGFVKSTFSPKIFLFYYIIVCTLIYLIHISLIRLSRKVLLWFKRCQEKLQS